MAASGKILGTVTSVVGEAKATAADGTVRILQVGDTVRSDETITTSAAGAVNIALENGKTLDCGANTDLSLHESILGVSTAAVTSKPAAPGSVEALQQAIASGQDPSQIAPATAAGGAPAAGGAGGDGSGGTPVIIEQANTAGVVESGFPTGGGSITFPTPEFELQNPEEEPPAVSVSVQVQVQVEVEVEVDVSVEAQPVVNGPSEGGVFAVSAAGDAVSLVEGTAEGTITIPFVITLDKVFDTDVQVTYQIVPDSASSPSDFFDGELTQTITIPAGETSFIVPIQIVRDHFVEGHESFHIVLLDATGATINPDKDEASVTIFNDDANPVANDDTNWTQEDTAVVAVGNVLQNQDHDGAPSGSFADAADTDFEPLTVTDPRTEDRATGTLVLNSDGSYTFTLNNANAAVQALDSGETLTETYAYSVTDGFNTPDSATLTVTIFGSNDGPEITVKTSGDIFASGAEGVVNEAALSFGSNPSSDGEFVTGSFKVSDTDGVDDIDSVTINGQTVAIGSIVGATFNGSAGTMMVTSYADGIANFTYELTQAVTDGEGAETDVFTLTTTDGTSTSAPANVTITIIDDVPSIDVSASASADALTVDETNLALNASANFADNFNSAPAFGADGAGSVSSGFALSVNAGSTGLVDTATNQAVVLSMNGGVVEGRTATSGDLVFTMSVNGSGTVTLDQLRAIVHADPSNPDDSTGMAAGLVTLTRTDTITDADGDTANDASSIDVGTALSFKDDGPSIDVSQADVDPDALTVDETNLALNASANFADNFNSAPTFGADGAGSVSSGFALSVNAGPTGLVDTATNQAVVLSMNGGVVEGRTATSGDLVFTLSVDGSGTVSLDQLRAVVHADASNPDDSTGIASGLVTLTRTDTITDKDGDTSSDSAGVDVGAAISFKDDGPSIDVSLADVGADALTVDETNLALNASANFADNFNSAPTFGADGAGSVSSGFALSVNAGATGLVDTATNQAVVLSMNGSVVEGRTVTSGDLVFTVSVDGSGTVTLDQVRAVVHENTSDPDDSTGIASGLVTLTRTDTITDNDGDTSSDSDSLDVGAALSFEDDGPLFTIVNDGNDDGTVSISAPNPASNTTFNAQFADWQYGADSFQGTPTLSGVSGSGEVVLSGASNANSLVIELEDAGGAIIGTLTLNADGTDSLHVINRAAEIVTDELLTGEADAGGPELIKTVESTLGLTVTVTASDGDGNPNEAADEVNPSTQGWAVKNNLIELDESIKFSLSEAIDRFSFRADGYTGGADAIGITVTVTYEGGGTESFDLDAIENQTIQVADLPGFNVGSRIIAVDVLNDGGEGAFRLNGVTISQVSETPAVDLDYNFTINVVDKDGDPVAQSFSVHLDGDNTGGLVVEAIAGTSGANSLVGTALADVLIGGGGNDTMAGGAQSDTFKFSGVLDSSSSDLITDFNLASGGDVLNLHDVLPTAAQGQTTEGALGAYIDVQNVSGNTIISIDADGAGGGAAVQVVTLQNVTTSLSELLSNNQIQT